MFWLSEKGSQFQKVHKFFFQILSFFFVALGQPAFLPWLGPFAASIGIALHWKALEGYSLSKIKKVSFVWFFLVQLVQTSWMANLEYQGLYILALYFLVSAALAWQFSFLTKVAYQNLRFDWFFMTFLAGLWTVFEWSRLYFFCGFSFNFLGISLSTFIYPLQVASLFGVLGMSFWVVLTNLSVWFFFRRISWRLGIRCGILICAPYLYGLIHLLYQDHLFAISKKGTYSVLLMQPALKPSQKYCLKGKEQDFIPPLTQWKNILGALSLHRPPFDLIALPEAVVPFGLDLYIYPVEGIQDVLFHHLGEGVEKAFPPTQPPFAFKNKVSNAYILQTISQFFNSPVIAGLDFQSSLGELYNSAFYFEPGVFSPKRYDKRILLPLAEYMPFSFLKNLSKYYGIEEFFSAGKEAKVFLPLRISPSICYEELFPSLMREGRNKGADLFVSLSNDGYYPSSKLPLQHFTHGLLRSVENGVPLIRACNTGVTSAVDSLGRVLGKLEDESGDVEKVSGCLYVQIPKNQYTTGYSLWGDLPLIAACWGMVIMVNLKKKFKRSIGRIFIKNSHSDT